MGNAIASNHIEKLEKNKIGIVCAISLLIGFSASILIYVISSYFKEVSGSDNVSIYILAPYFIIFILLLKFHKFVRTIGKSYIYFIFLGMQFLILTFLAITPVSFIGSILLIFYLVTSTMITIISNDIILESFSLDRMSGRIRGINSTMFNLGVLCGPFISSYILLKFNYSGIFVTQIFVCLLIFIIAYFGLKNFNEKNVKNFEVKNTITRFFKEKNYILPYYLSFVLNFFYAIMVFYSSLYLINLGIPLENFGIIFTLMLIPFVLIQLPAGFLADKKGGEKELIILAVLILSSSVLPIYFLNTKSIIIWASILFITRIGAALLEILSDTYFYKKVDGRDVDIIDFYRTANPLSHIFAFSICALLLRFFPLKSVFVLLFLILLTGLYPAFLLNNNKIGKKLKPWAK